ncbi:unnamed protein product [Nezara viridula]|uniref:Uncharacterized protein n=1 Tax=Nezara viridula TaxID=85310 RepID=A0A9P0MQC0_NEZVI|nr:unnamed protein product [Nezara viridula]
MADEINPSCPIHIKMVEEEKIYFGDHDHVHMKQEELIIDEESMIAVKGEEEEVENNYGGHANVKHEELLIPDEESMIVVKEEGEEKEEPKIDDGELNQQEELPHPDETSQAADGSKITMLDPNTIPTIDISEKKESFSKKISSVPKFYNTNRRLLQKKRTISDIYQNLNLFTSKRASKYDELDKKDEIEKQILKIKLERKQEMVQKMKLKVLMEKEMSLVRFEQEKQLICLRLEQEKELASIKLEYERQLNSLKIEQEKVKLMTEEKKLKQILKVKALLKY